jgi:hypothetical protein
MRKVIIMSIILPIIISCSLLSPSITGVNFTISAVKGWQDTGINIKSNSQIIFSYQSGRWSINKDGEYTDANGYYNNYPNMIEGVCKNAPLPDELSGALVGRVGNGKVFIIGNTQKIISNNDGILFLSINDACLGDNAGDVVVNIVVTK